MFLCFRRRGGIGFYSCSLEHFHDLARVHHVAQEIVDVGEACGLRFVGCRIGAVAQSDRNDIARLGVSRQPLHAPVRRTSGDNQNPHVFHAEKSFQFGFVKGARSYFGYDIVVGGRLELVNHLRARLCL